MTVLLCSTFLLHALNMLTINIKVNNIMLNVRLNTTIIKKMFTKCKLSKLPDIIFYYVQTDILQKSKLFYVYIINSSELFFV